MIPCLDEMYADIPVLPKYPEVDDTSTMDLLEVDLLTGEIIWCIASRKAGLP